MNDTKQAIDALKRCLRARGITYRDVAAALDLSEPSVKRLFSERSFSLERLEAVCALADMTLFELTRLAEAREAPITSLTQDQEKRLAENPKLLTCFYLLLNGWTADEIVGDYEVDTVEVIRLLAALDRLGLIELLPGNRVRLLTARHVDWRRGGPVRAVYEQQARAEFLEADFTVPGRLFETVTGELTEASIDLMQRKLGLVLRDFDELVELDASAPRESKKSVALLMAFRPWVFSVFTRQKR